MFDTRINIFSLLDHKEYYGYDKSLADAKDFIKDISSLTLLNYISGFGANLYLNENSEKSGKVQAFLVDCLLRKCGEEAIRKWLSVVKEQGEKGFNPIMIWSYSNLLFYGLIFENFNSIPSKDLTREEAQKVFDAYLIINSIANNKIKIEKEEIELASEANQIEDVVIPNFIYQKDYASTTDFSNQVTRGMLFFPYLENHSKYSAFVSQYYQEKKLSGYLRMFKNLIALFSLIKIESEQRQQLIDLEEYYKANEVDLEYIGTLCINDNISTYKEDVSFGLIREKFLYKLTPFKYFILDINFLIDSFYKAQVFSFNSFLKKKKYKGDFYADKGKEFMEGVYLSTILQKCFPIYIKFFSDGCVNSSKEELCDAYLRDNNKICLIECKDVLLNATKKNSGNKDVVYPELDIKFLTNQKGKAKGVSQLIAAIKDIEEHSITFDNITTNNTIEIYPVLIYTDFSFGVEGLNKIYKQKFKKEIDKLRFKNIHVKDITFVNINFFELREDYLAQGLINLFTMLDEYHQHCLNQDYELTPFEVYSRFYMENNIPQDLGLPSFYKSFLSAIVAVK